jgi:hypothetical protein
MKKKQVNIATIRAKKDIEAIEQALDQGGIIIYKERKQNGRKVLHIYTENRNDQLIFFSQ